MALSVETPHGVPSHVYPWQSEDPSVTRHRILWSSDFPPLAQDQERPSTHPGRAEASRVPSREQVTQHKNLAGQRLKRSKRGFALTAVGTDRRRFFSTGNFRNPDLQNPCNLRFDAPSPNHVLYHGVPIRGIPCISDVLTSMNPFVPDRGPW